MKDTIIYYDEEKKEFVSKVTNDESNVVNMKPTTLRMGLKRSNSLNNRLVAEFTNNNKNRDIIVKKCKICGKYFIISYSHYLWFMSKDYKLPNRCDLCREEKHGSNDI